MTASPTARVVLAVAGLQVLATEVEDEHAERARAARGLVAQVATALLETLQGRRPRTWLAAVLAPEVRAELAEWHTALAWEHCRVAATHASVLGGGAVEGSFELATGAGRRETFTVRLERDGRRWTAVHLRPLRDLAPPVAAGRR